MTEHRVVRVNPYDAKVATAIASILRAGNWLNVTVTVERPGVPPMRVVRSSDGVYIEFGDDTFPTNA